MASASARMGRIAGKWHGLSFSVRVGGGLHGSESVCVVSVLFSGGRRMISGKIYLRRLARMILRVVLSRCFMLFADGGGHARAESELQSAAWGGGELRGSKSRRHNDGNVLGQLPAGNATMRMPLRASAAGGCGPHDSASRPFSFLLRYLLFGQKVTEKPPR